LLEGVYDGKGPPEHESHVDERVGGVVGGGEESMADVFGLQATGEELLYCTSRLGDL
jgi:hypothetical protein